VSSESGTFVYNGDGSVDLAMFRPANSTWYINGQGSYPYGSSVGIKCWGDNGYGQLGDGTTTDRNAPVNVSGLTTDAAAVSIGGDHSCALTSGGIVKCWGENADGQIGNGTLVDSNVPLDTAFSSSTTYTPDTSHKHAVASLSTGESYTYDANGNMTQRVEGGLTYTQVFDAENRLISVTVNSQTTQFVYDGDGNLIKKIKPDGSKTLYVGGVYEVDKTSGGSVTRTVTYYPAAGAMRIDSSLYYVLKDHLGSASVVTNASGATVGEQRYYPFGETRLTTGSIFTDQLFTGQREMAGLGIYHYQARFYSPYINQFLSADTIVPSFANPQSLNRYSYVTNNPLRFTDPTGHRPCEEYQGQCLSEEQMTTQYESNLEKLKEKPKNKNKNKGGGGENAADFLSNFAYGADIAGVVLSDIEMIVVDTIGVLMIAEGCARAADLPVL
jgi:RHS repeat-associated protein